MDDRSRELYEAACALIPGGVNSPVRACRNVESLPLFIAEAHGAHLKDVDGRVYVDFVLSWGPMILGHDEPSVTAALREAVGRGTSFGAPCPDEVKLAQEVVAAMPGLEMVRMVNSGTEATMSALRLARAVTGRDKVVKFIGCYHGHADPFLAAAGSGVATLSIPGTPGVPRAVVEETLLVPYNDLEAATACFQKHGEHIAAVIVEPVAANMGLVLPLPGFLEGLRQLTEEYRSLLIFDEVITGFRLAYGGAQARFGIDPDLTCFGKIIGGGLPVGAFGGKRRYMERVAPAGDVYQAGTLSGNPLAMAAGLATLTRLKTEDYAALEKRTAAFAKELADILRAKGVAVQMPTIASMFCPFFSATPVANFEQSKKCDQKLFTAFYKQMRAQGIYLAPSGFETGMVSFAHTKDDFDRALTAAKAVKFPA
ncbi:MULTISPECIES: glutamate-1-semialdehyde 2,1-aminomutase [unclassified Desulfovibrio]|uniref:glutamate-1-semialdehyde 2,1-aminomutase n=1 Tax=unclassified Desulfovibrio TaxID=2593640 RepID=UPI0013EA5E22|nr:MULTISPECIES: glutamate-1-semialdehyde 2,1-aminomutase [unclassified Desulfovibrio]